METDCKVIEGEELVCSKCKFELGMVFNQRLIMVGNLLLSEAHGVCARCGTAFHYTATERQLKKLLALVLSSRSKALADLNKCSHNAHSESMSPVQRF